MNPATSQSGPHLRSSRDNPLKAMSKRIRYGLTALVAVGALLATAGCADTEASPGGASGNDTVTVGYSGYTLTNPYFAGLIKGLEDGAAKHGYKLITTNSNGDNNVQTSDIENLIGQGADYILICPSDSTAIAPAVAAAKAAGIPVIALSDKIASNDLAFTIAMNHVTIGEQSAAGVVDFLKKKNGEPKGNVVNIQGIAGSAAAADRQAGFDKVMGQYPNIKVVATQDGGFDTDKAFQVMSNILQANKDIDAVFTANDSEAQGVTKAIEAAGRFKPVGEPGHIFVTGNDAPAPAVADIRAGRQDMTVSANPIKMSIAAMDRIADLIAGKQVEKTIEWPGKVITKENIDSAEVKEYGIWADEL
jgi:ABC-type sugar transport system substrate-binding protein